MQQLNASLVYGRKLNQNQLFFDRTTIKQSVPMQQSHRQCSTPLYQEQPSQMVEIATLKPPKQQLENPGGGDHVTRVRLTPWPFLGLTIDN